MVKQAVILSGGFGKRLSHVVSDVPKPMAPIKNKPFLEYIITQLQKQGFERFLFLTGYKSEFIEKYFKNLPNSQFLKEEKALGTGGALLNAYELLEDEFFVINGDTFFDIDFSILENFSKTNHCTIALRYTNNITRYGFVEIDDSFKILSFTEKGNLPQNRIDGYINGGIYYINKSVLKEFAYKFSGQFISLETEIFPEFPAVKLTLCAPPSIHTLSLDNVPFVADKFTLPIQSEEIVIVTVSPGLTVFLLVLIFIYAALTHLGNNIITRANIKIIIIFFVCVLFIFNHIPFL